MNSREIMEAYDALRKKMIAICDARYRHFHMDFREENECVLFADGDSAVFRRPWVEDEVGVLEWEDYRIPLSVLDYHTYDAVRWAEQALEAEDRAYEAAAAATEAERRNTISMSARFTLKPVVD